MENLILSEPLFWSLVTACTAGFIMLSYDELRVQKAWPAGRFYRSNISKLIGGLSIIGSVGFSIARLSLLYGLGVFVLGFVLGLVLSLIWKSNVQWIAIILLAGSWIFQFFI